MSKEDIRNIAQKIVKTVYKEDNYYDAYEAVEEILISTFNQNIKKTKPKNEQILNIL